MVGAKAEACKDSMCSDVFIVMNRLTKVEEKFDLTAQDIEHSVVRYHESCPNGTNIVTCTDCLKTEAKPRPNWQRTRTRLAKTSCCILQSLEHSALIRCQEFTSVNIPLQNAMSYFHERFLDALC